MNNATGWIQDTFLPAGTDRLGRSLRPVSAATWHQQFTVDAMAAALLIGEFARRHIARDADWGRIIGLTSGADLGFPEEVSYGAAKAAQTSYTMSAALELARHGSLPTWSTRGHRHRLGHRRRSRQPGADPHRQPGRCRRHHRLSRLRRSSAHHR